MERFHPITVSFFVLMALVFGWILGTMNSNNWKAETHLDDFQRKKLTNRNPPSRYTVNAFPTQRPVILEKMNKPNVNVPVVFEKMIKQNTNVPSMEKINKPNLNVPIRNKISTIDVYRIESNSNMWKRDEEICTNLPPFRRATIRNRHMTFPMFIHEPMRDVHVSGTIARGGVWEGSNVDTLTNLLKKFPTADFIDIGSNLGLFAFVAAKLGRKVIAVEPVKFNVQRICKTMQINNFLDNFTIINNALSNEARSVTMAQAINNVGGTFIIESNDPQVKRKALSASTKKKEIFQTTKLDNILDIPNFNLKDVLMKIDVEGYEDKVLTGGMKFFDQVNVRGILMEWMMHLSGPTNTAIIQFLTSRNFEAFHPFNPDMKMRIEESSRWPVDILWLKKEKPVNSPHRL